MSSKNDAIRAEGLSKIYTIYARPFDRLRELFGRSRHRLGRKFIALSNVSFNLKRGEVLGIVGNNGAGKSTLLQVICGILKPSTGQLAVRGRIAALLELGAGFNPEFTGRENIFLNAAVLGLSDEEIRARFDSIVAFSGIADFIEQPVKTYSSGMYVRLAFSIATSVDPDILIIDEALSVGDGSFARKSFDRIMALRERGATILFCSHSMYQIEAICDKALWLDQGHMRMLDSPERVVNAYTGSQNFKPQEDPQNTAQKAHVLPLLQGQARIVDISAIANGVSGNKVSLVSGVSDLEIVVSFQCDPDLPPPNVAFAIETMTGTSISSGSTGFDATTTSLDKMGIGKIVLAFPKMPLMRGEYRVSIYLTCERSLHLYDQALYCVSLQVKHQGIEQGVVFLPHTWDGGEIRTAPIPISK